jgi:hypothetical protein
MAGVQTSEVNAKLVPWGNESLVTMEDQGVDGRMRSELILGRLAGEV